MANKTSPAPKGEIIASIQFVNPANFIDEVTQDEADYCKELSSGLSIYASVLINKIAVSAIVSTAIEEAGHKPITVQDVVDDYMLLVFADPPISKEGAHAIGEVISSRAGEILTNNPDGAHLMPTIFLPVH